MAECPRVRSDRATPLPPGQVTKGNVLTGTIILIRNDDLPALLLTVIGSSVSKQQSTHRNDKLPRLALS